MTICPRRDQDGKVVPHDDAAIEPESILIRYIDPENHLVPDENIGGRRVGSNAFHATSKDPDYGMSVDIGQLLVEANRELGSRVKPGFGAVGLRVGDVRTVAALKVGSDPLPENEFHGQVWGVKNKVSKRLSRLATWVVSLPGVGLPPKPEGV